MCTIVYGPLACFWPTHPAYWNENIGLHSLLEDDILLRRQRRYQEWRVRTCLRCNRKSESTWSGHRRCVECEKAIAMMLPVERASYHKPRRARAPPSCLKGSHNPVRLRVLPGVGPPHIYASTTAFSGRVPPNPCLFLMLPLLPPRCSSKALRITSTL